MTTIRFAPKASRLFTVRQSGDFGSEIISPRGKVIAWSVEPLFDDLICLLLNEFMVNDDFFDTIFAKKDFS